MAGYHNWFEYGRNDAEHSAGVLWVRSITKAIYICILMIATQHRDHFLRPTSINSDASSCRTILIKNDGDF